MVLDFTHNSELPTRNFVKLPCFPEPPMRTRIAAFIVVATLAAHAQQPRSLFPNDVRHQMDVAATQILADTGVPSASIAVVKDGRMVPLCISDCVTSKSHTNAHVLEEVL